MMLKKAYIPKEVLHATVRGKGGFSVAQEMTPPHDTETLSR